MESKKTVFSQNVEEIIKISDFLDKEGLNKISASIDNEIKNIVEKHAQYVGGQGYALRNTRCWNNCYRQKRSKDLNPQKSWSECLAEYTNSINDDESGWEKYASSSIIKNNIDNLLTISEIIKNAGYEEESIKMEELSHSILKESQGFFSGLGSGIKGFFGNKGFSKGFQEGYSGVSQALNQFKDQIINDINRLGTKAPTKDIKNDIQKEFDYAVKAYRGYLGLVKNDPNSDLNKYITQYREIYEKWFNSNLAKKKEDIYKSNIFKELSFNLENLIRGLEQPQPQEQQQQQSNQNNNEQILLAAKRLIIKFFAKGERKFMYDAFKERLNEVGPDQAYRDLLSSIQQSSAQNNQNAGNQQNTGNNQQSIDNIVLALSSGGKIDQNTFDKIKAMTERVIGKKPNTQDIMNYLESLQAGGLGSSVI